MILAALLALTVPGGAALAAPYADIVVDANTGRVLHATDETADRYPASLTKMMTLYVVFEMLATGRLTEDSTLVISERAALAAPSKLGLKPGDRIKLSDAVRALVTKSANDVALAVAENIAGTEEKFARYMTWRAKRLGMNDTVFRNASGLPDPGQHSTARDLATLALRLQDHFPNEYKVFRTTFFTWKGKRHRNHNGLLFSLQGTDGIKTGYTRASGFNLVSSVKRDGRHVIGVVLGGRSARERNARMRQLLKDGLAKASTKKTREAVPREGVAVAEKKRVKPAAETVAVASADPATSAFVPPKPTLAKKDLLKKLAAIEASAPGAPLATSAASPGVPGPFHIQVGAYGSEDEAKRRLGEVRAAAGSLLEGHDPLAVAVAVSAKTFYRARFAGFDEARARLACSNLKQQSIDCLVMRAE